MSEISPINTTLDDVFKTTPIGSIETAISSVLYGINHRQTANLVPPNKDGYGLTFFVRPQLNLTTENLRAERSFIPLLTKEAASIPRYIRCSLDPRLSELSEEFRTPVMDNRSAFITILTNHLTSCSGWPEPTIEQFTSKPGAYKEVFSMTDSSMDIYSAYDITATFRNMQSDPITNLFYTWTRYQASVFQGIMVPYPDFLVRNEIDYNTRIYRLILDSTKRYVQKIACTGVATPVSNDMGAAFDFSSDKPYNTAKENITIQFKCIGAHYNDPIVVHEFNSVVGIFNPYMKEDNEGNISPLMTKIAPEFLSIFNNSGYPRIDPDTMELNWYIENTDYQRLLASYVRHLGAMKIDPINPINELRS